MIRRACVGAGAVRRRWWRSRPDCGASRRQPRARRGPGLLHRRRDPARRRHARAHGQGGAKSVRRIQSNPNNQDVVAFTGFDFIGGGFRNNAATIFVTQIPWDERKVTRASSWSASFFGKTGDIKEGAGARVRPAARSSGSAPRAASSSTSRTAARAARKRLDEVDAGTSSARQHRTRSSCSAQTLWRAERAAALRRRRPREGEEARRADRRRSSTRCRRRSAPTTSTTSTSTAARGRC